MILLHTQAKRSIKVNGYPRNRPQCTWEFIIQKKSKGKIWDYSVKLEWLANGTETAYFPLKFLLHFFLATCWPARTAFPTLPHSQVCPQDYVLANGSRKWHAITCPELSPSSFTWREPSYGSNPAMTMQITTVTIPRATGQKEPDSQRPVDTGSSADLLCSHWNCKVKKKVNSSVLWTIAYFSPLVTATQPYPNE